MPPAVALIIVFIFIFGSIGLYVFSFSLDKDRIRDYITTRGGKVIETNWAPFGPGWFGEKSDRIHQVIYIDAEGNKHDAYCKTSLFTGVYFTEDKIIVPATPKTTSISESPDEAEKSVENEKTDQVDSAESGKTSEELLKENERLKEEINRLKNLKDTN
ncbi:DivIVA domain-containing protein [Myxococcota bacterium]|nr:DivIVA domain-containing protein [Myxococcota bacterium]MBU1497555.1 DivIVA domain-containing protein [Myxococcota bacterium]